MADNISGKLIAKLPAATAAEESLTELDDEEEEWGDWDDESFDEDAFNDALVSQLEALG